MCSIYLSILRDTATKEKRLMTKAIRQAMRDNFVTLGKSKSAYTRDRNLWWEICKQKNIPFVEIRTRPKSSLVSMDTFTIGTELNEEDLNKLLTIAEATKSESTYLPHNIKPIFGRVMPQQARLVAQTLFDMGMETLKRGTD